MRKREIFWIVVLLLLGGLYLYNHNQNQKKEIDIIASFRPGPRRGGAGVYPTYFTMDGYYKLTDIKVTALEANKSDPPGHVLWHIVSKTNSAEIKLFQYGQMIAGMDPELKGVKPEPLVAGLKYRLDLACGKLKGSVPTFIPKAIESK